MPSIPSIRPVASFFTGNFALFLIPAAAFAADRAALDLSNARWWAILGFVQIITILGYTASSLSQWAGWIDGTVLVRLQIIQGVAVALLAGNVAYFCALHSANLPEVYALMSSGAGGYGGDKFLTPVLTRIFGKATGQPQE